MSTYQVCSYYFFQCYYVINKRWVLKGVVLLQEICEEIHTAIFLSPPAYSESAILPTSFQLKNK